MVLYVIRRHPPRQPGHRHPFVHLQSGIYKEICRLTLALRVCYCRMADRYALPRHHLIVLGNAGCGKSTFLANVTRHSSGTMRIDASVPSRGVQFAEHEYGGSRWSMVDVGDAERLRPKKSAQRSGTWDAIEEDPILSSNRIVPKGVASAILVFVDATRIRETVSGAQTRWLPVAENHLTRRVGETAIAIVLTHTDVCGTRDRPISFMQAETVAFRHRAHFWRINATIPEQCDALMERIRATVDKQSQ